MSSHAQRMLQKIEQLLEENPGVKTITFGGQTVTYDDLMGQRDRYKAEIAQESGQCPLVREITLGGV